MADTVAVEVARSSDRDEIVEALAARGIEARPVDGGFEVSCEDVESRCEELVAELEEWLADHALPFVPTKLAGRILLRPPAG